ncbi:MAG TPA: helix-hairpin-helix domain-containing protein [Bacteroidota bacterium]|nr:helix-hairpin-helix domain-containing protein [Bacteroidota bacterium]
MLQRLKEWLALTETERKVLLFLSITLAVGLGIKFYRATFPEVRSFDYTASDSTFAVLSAQEVGADDGERVKPGEKLDINKATKAQLMKLPGIGEVTAERILIYREEVGRINNLEELRTIKGITAKRFNQLKNYITLH